MKPSKLVFHYTQVLPSNVSLFKQHYVIYFLPKKTPHQAKQNVLAFA